VQVAAPAELVAHPADDFVARMIETPMRRAERLSAALSLQNA
jgi:ABC-type proline/glycine betaine transport system ATPase subunit